MQRGAIINVTVHGIGPVDRPLDAGEDRTWVTVAQIESAMDAAVGRPDVRITFDDGNRSDVEIALPRLLERGLRAEFFVLAGRLGDAGWLDAADVKELVDAGMAVGSHGWAHRDWRRLDEDTAREEIDEAPRVLERIAGRPVRRVAIPFGSYDRRVLARLRRSGVQCAFTSDGGHARPAAGCRTARACITTSMPPHCIGCWFGGHLCALRSGATPRLLPSGFEVRRDDPVRLVNSRGAPRTRGSP